MLCVYYIYNIIITAILIIDNIDIKNDVSDIKNISIIRESVVCYKNKNDNMKVIEKWFI